MSTPLADKSWLTANPEESLTNKDWMNSLSRTTVRVLDTAKTEEQKEYHIAWNAWKRCCKKVVDSQGGHFTGIHVRFLRDPVYRESQLAIGWTEQKCKEWDEHAKEDHACHLSPGEFRRYQGQWYLTLNKTGKKWSYEASIRFSSCCLCQKSSARRVRRTS